MDDDLTEKAIDEALDGQPRARELAEMIAALESRRAAFQRERDAATDEAVRHEREARLQEVERQVQTLREEQAINQFVENEVRATINRPGLGLVSDDDLDI